jgi:hypothetical protein
VLALPQALGAAILSATSAETITTKNRTACLWFERYAVGLAALIANNLEAFPLGAASLFRSTKICAARVTTGLTAFRMTQSALAIIVLFSFSKWETVSTFTAINLQVWHSSLPRKTFT